MTELLHSRAGACPIKCRSSTGNVRGSFVADPWRAVSAEDTDEEECHRSRCNQHGDDVAIGAMNAPIILARGTAVWLEPFRSHPVFGCPITPGPAAGNVRL